MACHCKDFSRAAILRETAARAGAGGLRAIEPGMPVPAGTGLSRRSFLAASTGLGLAVFGGRALAPAAWEDGIASAAAAAPNAPVVVSVFLSGGADSLSMLAPLGHARYAQLRTSLAVSSNLAFSEDPSLYWHPSLAPIKALHDAGKVTVLPAVGYDHPNQSHFTSRHYYEVGELNPLGRVGWMGRYLDRHGAADNPLQGLSLDYSLAPSLAAANVPVAAVSSPESYRLWTRDLWDANLTTKLNQRFGALGAVATDDPELAAARGAARQTIKLQEQLAPLAAANWTPPGSYPDEWFASRLAVLAEMLGRGMPLRCVAIDANGGYDTHDNQAAALPGMLDVFARSIAAFQADLEARGLANRVLIHVWSEFGRRPQQNGTGTDHGAAGIGLLIGTQVKGAMVGGFPGLAQLDQDGNLKATSDFRHVYKHIVSDWLGVDPAGIVPDAAKFTTPLALFR